MTHFLKTVLEIDEPLFKIGLIALEKSTGNSGVDTRLIADVLEKGHKAMRVLGLDVSNTTGRELYHSLIAAVKNNNIELLLIDTDYVLLVLDGKTISLNMIDVIENSHHELPYDKQIISHGQRGLRGELVGRYIDHVRTNESTTLEIASDIGLLPERDAWYNNFNHKRKYTDSHPKELVK